MTALTDATFYAPLKTTLVLTNGSGNPTFTRATTKTVEDNEGKVKTLKSGAVGLAGARVGQNWLNVCTNPVTSSEDFSNAEKGACNLVYSAGVITAEVTGATSFFRPYAANSFSVFSVVDTRIYLAIKARGVGSSIGKLIFIMSECAGDSQTPITFTLTADWQTIYFHRPAKISTTLEAMYISLRYTSANVGIGEFVEFKEMQVSPYVCDYISAGVLSAPFHGAGVDGVKYFATDSSAVAIPDETMLGAQLDAASKTNTLLWCRDFTNAAWVKTNVTATKDQTGITNQVNSCSLIEFTADGGTVLQTIVAAAAVGCSGYWVKWHTEVGTVEFTRDNVTWLDITSELSTGAFYVAKIENTSVTNPVIGFRGSNGGKIIVDAGLNHLGTQLCEPIFTTTANVTRNAEVLTYQTASNFSDTAGTILATFRPTHDTWPSGSIVGKASFGLLASASNSGVQAADGTNTVSGAAGTPTGQRRIGARWSGSSLQAFYEDEYGAIGSYDGSFNLSTIAINPGVAGYIRDIAIFDSWLSDVDMPWYVAAAFVPTSYDIIVSLAETDIEVSYLTNSITVDLAVTNIEVSG